MFLSYCARRSAAAEMLFIHLLQSVNRAARSSVWKGIYFLISALRVSFFSSSYLARSRESLLSFATTHTLLLSYFLCSRAVRVFASVSYISASWVFCSPAKAVTMPGPNSMLEWMAGRNFVDDTTKKKKKDKKKEPPVEVSFGFATDDANQTDTVVVQFPRHGNPLRPKRFSSNISTNPDGSGVDVRSSLGAVGCSDDDEDAKSVITSKSKATVKSAKSIRSSRAHESAEEPNLDCNCIDCVVGCRTLRRLGIEPRGKVRHDAPSSRKSRAVRSKKKSKEEDDSDATVVLSSDEDDEESPSPPRRSKSQRRRGHERSSQSRSGRAGHSSSRSHARDNSISGSSTTLRDTPPANIMPPQPRRVQMEHTIENPNSDPRPNAYVDSQRNHVRVYHGPHWGSAHGTSHQQPHAAYPPPAPSPTYGQPVMGYSPTPHGHHQPYQHGACPLPCCARPHREGAHQHPVATGQPPHSFPGSPSHDPRYPYSPQEPWRYNTGPPPPPVAVSPGVPYRTHASPGYPVAPPATVAGMGTTTGVEAASRRYSTRHVGSPQAAPQYTALDVERILEEYNRKQREQGSRKASENKTSRSGMDDSARSVSERYWASKEKEEEQPAARMPGKRNQSGNDNRGGKSRGSGGDNNNESSASAWDNVASGADSSNPGESGGKDKQDSSQNDNEFGGPSKGSPSDSQNANKNKKGDKKSNNADNGNDKASPNPGKDSGSQSQNPKNKKGNDKNFSESSRGGDKQKPEAAKGNNNDKQSPNPNGGKGGGGGKGKKGEGKNKDGNKGSPPKESDNASEEKADHQGSSPPDATAEDTEANTVTWDPFNTTTADETPSGEDMFGTAEEAGPSSAWDPFNTTADENPSSTTEATTAEATTDDTPNGGAWGSFDATADETPNGTADSSPNGGAWDSVQDDSQTQKGGKNGNGNGKDKDNKKKKNKAGRQSNASSSGGNTDSGSKTNEWGGTEEKKKKKEGNDDGWGTTSNDNDNGLITGWGDLPTDNGDSAGQGNKAPPEYGTLASSRFGHFV